MVSDAIGLRYLMLTISQNLYLITVYLKFGIIALGAGGANESDAKLGEMLWLLPNDESAFLGFAVGHPATE